MAVSTCGTRPAAPRGCLMNLVDDATGRTLARLGAQETIWAAVDVLRRWIEAYGVPLALYTDWKNVYVRDAECGGAGHGGRAPDAIWPDVRRVGDSDHRGEFTAGEGPRRAESRHASGSPREETAAVGDRGRARRRMRFWRRPICPSTTAALRCRPRRPRTFIAGRRIGPRSIACFSSRRPGSSPTTGSIRYDTRYFPSGAAEPAGARRAARCWCGRTRAAPLNSAIEDGLMQWTEIAAPVKPSRRGPAARCRAPRIGPRGRARTIPWRRDTRAIDRERAR